MQNTYCVACHAQLAVLQGLKAKECNIRIFSYSQNIHFKVTLGLPRCNRSASLFSLLHIVALGSHALQGWLRGMPRHHSCERKDLAAVKVPADH
jgi:hypothetical protein